MDPVANTQTAIATSVDLRCFAVLSPRADGKIALETPSLDVDAEWDIAGLPWNLLPVHTDGSRRVADTELDTALLQALEAAAYEHEADKRTLGAKIAFLYLYMVITGSPSHAFAATFTALANLPIGAGLGSSAAYSTCIATALLKGHGHISEPTDSLHADDIDLVDGWAFLAEKILHGNPSGIDNAVSARGGAVAFQRAIGGKKGGMDVLNGFTSIRLLLTDTLVPRDTKSLVAGVSAKRMAEPEVVDPILDAIQAIADESRGLLGGASHVARHDLIKRLEVRPNVSK